MRARVLLLVLVALRWATPAVLVVPADGFCAPEARLVRVPLTGTITLELLQREGFDLVEGGPGGATLLEWPGDADRLAALGASTQVIDADPGASAARRAHAELGTHRAPGRRVISAARSDGVFRAETLPAFGFGSMMGFWTTAEVKMKLDAMVADDTRGVVADKVDTLGYSAQGRPIWGLRLGRAPSPNVPSAYFNALTHAREPEGMQALMYFAADLLAGYGSNSWATSLLDRRSIYLVPIVNPDGYALNEASYAGNGKPGFWRKNCRDNDGDGLFNICCDGVDLNRNYGYQWGYNDVGSSPNKFANNYRGTAAWSEPEIRAQRDLVTLRRPASALSFHTYQDVVLHAWAYTATPPPHLSALREWDDWLTRRNAFQSGPASTVLYESNGEFNDWCYGDTLMKPRTWSWTSEVGSDVDGFWPPPSRITPLARAQTFGCYFVASIAGSFVQAERWELAEGALNAGDWAQLNVVARNLGSANTGGAVAARVSSLDNGAYVLASYATYPALASRSSGSPAGATFQIAAHDTVTPGRLLRFAIAFTTPDGFISPDTISIPCGMPSVLAFDNATGGLGKWNSGSWGITSDPDHPAPFFAESPTGGYTNGANNIMQFTATLDLSRVVHAYAEYGSRWDVQRDYDGVVVEASRNGSAWTRLSATGTHPGTGMSNAQTAGLPIYSGTRHRWRRERVDLSSFTGAGAAAVRFRLRMLADNAGQYDGWNFDSLRIVAYDPAMQPAPVAVGDAAVPPRLALGAPSPNPASGRVRLDFALPRAGGARMEILDLAGRRVRGVFDGTLGAGTHVFHWDGRRDGGKALAAGIYLIRLSADGESRSRRVAIIP